MHSHPKAASSSASRAADAGAPPTEIWRTLDRSRSGRGRVVEDQPGHGGDQEEPRDAVRLDEAEHLAGVEAGQQHVHAARARSGSAGVPHPLTWNSGIVCRMTSSPVRPIVERAVHGVEVEPSMAEQRALRASPSIRTCRRARPAPARRRRGWARVRRAGRRGAPRARRRAATVRTACPGSGWSGCRNSTTAPAVGRGSARSSAGARRMFSGSSTPPASRTP